MDSEEILTIYSCQKGELEKFSILYNKYIKRIYDFIFYKVHHKETAEDITSQIFFKALNKIQGFDPKKGTLQAWLYQIARNTVIDYYRTKKENKNIEDAWDLCGDDDLERDIDAKAKLQELEKYISKLKSDHRDILIMRIWQDLSYKEIAEAMGKSEDSCKMQFSRCIRKLREEMPMIVFISFLLTRL